MLPFRMRAELKTARVQWGGGEPAEKKTTKKWSSFCFVVVESKSFAWGILYSDMYIDVTLWREYQDRKRLQRTVVSACVDWTI